MPVVRRKKQALDYCLGIPGPSSRGKQDKPNWACGVPGLHKGKGLLPKG
jgi:hypothetical protein